jgi:protein-disulfide isomerase
MGRRGREWTCNNGATVSTGVTPFRSFVLALTLAALGCHAQLPAGSAHTADSQANGANAGGLSPELARRIEVLIRSRANVPAEYEIHIGAPHKSDMPGFNEITVEFSAAGKQTAPLNFLLSLDGKTLAQFKKFDISQDPKNLVSGADRPARGGSANAPVLIVGFDDLECPFCARMNEELFPALLKRYKDQVRIVYRDFPLQQHPWAMRAAIDVNCVGAQSTTGYWNLVDYIHAHAGEIGGSTPQDKTVAKASEMLDKLARDEGTRQKVKADVLDACIAKQDASGIEQSMKEGEALGVEATPALFINGEKIEGAQPIEYVYRMIDGALVAAGQKPPAPEATPSPTSPKPGN